MAQIEKLKKELEKRNSQIRGMNKRIKELEAELGKRHKGRMGYSL